jgi:3-isopropylmalate/(R)-2-methylmalate dehydratase small subunit
LLPVQVSDDFLKKLLPVLQENPQVEIVVNLEKQTIETPIGTATFEIDAYKKTCMLNGYDDIDFLISKKETINAFEARL